MKAATLAKAMPGLTTAHAKAEIDGANQALRLAGCTTVNRAAMFLAQVGTESMSLRYTEEIASGAAYEGRADLGNTHPGDGRRFKGRSYIQVTGRHNYTNMSHWAHDKGLVPNANYFVNHPAKLATAKYRWLGPVWYWTTQRPMNRYADNNDIVGATRAVNGGTRGLSDRRSRYQRAKTLGKTILPTGGGSLKAASKAAKVKTETTYEALHPTLDAIHTPYGKKGSMWSSGYHQGDDWHRNAGDAEIGDPIHATADGRVIFAGQSGRDGAGWGPAFGNHVLITWTHKVKGESFHRTVIDAHMSKVVAKYGQHVKAGDLIGYKGKSGNVTGAHDHHEHHAGTGWGDRDLKPVYPGKTTTKTVAAGPDPADLEELDVATQLPRKHRSKNQTVKPTKNGEYQTLRLENSGDVTWAFGGDRYQVECYLRFHGIGPSDELMVRALRVDTDSKTGKVIGKPHGYAVTGKKGSGGKTFEQWSWRFHVGKPKKGRTRRMRIGVANYSSHDIVVDEVITYVWRASLHP